MTSALRMAGMQPYFFPYLGYWQLIDAVDCFVLFDEAQYMKGGWINRNRVLKPGGGWQYIHVPVAKHPRDASICDVRIASGEDWQTRIVNQLAHYRPIAAHFADTLELVRACLDGGEKLGISALNCQAVRQVCAALGIRSQIVVSSAQDFDYADVAGPGDWALAHARQMGAAEIVNPVTGIALQDSGKLAAHGIGLSALHPPVGVAYSQGGKAPFEAALSIIDVLMFNGIVGTRDLLAQRRIEKWKPELSPAMSGRFQAV
ncbi:WbqC family protein [Variovorax sp. ZT5P49]|uniref:WbqC family protein n=1 Tax=Variovorax sp. ZT5P49 TaxID=3443733 RepID=UPI003F47016F